MQSVSERIEKYERMAEERERWAIERGDEAIGAAAAGFAERAKRCAGYARQHDEDAAVWRCAADQLRQALRRDDERAWRRGAIQVTASAR